MISNCNDLFYLQFFRKIELQKATKLFQLKFNLAFCAMNFEDNRGVFRTQSNVYNEDFS